MVDIIEEIVKDVEEGEEALKEKIKAKKKSEMLIPLEEYVKSGIYLGTKVVTPKMKEFVYRRRADGLAIFNTDLIDEKLKEGLEYLSKFDAKDVILFEKRKSGWKAAELFSCQTASCIQEAVWLENSRDVRQNYRDKDIY